MKKPFSLPVCLLAYVKAARKKERISLVRRTQNTFYFKKQVMAVEPTLINEKKIVDCIWTYATVVDVVRG